MTRTGGGQCGSTGKARRCLGQSRKCLFAQVKARALARCKGRIGVDLCTPPFPLSGTLPRLLSLYTIPPV